MQKPALLLLLGFIFTTPWAAAIGAENIQPDLVQSPAALKPGHTLIDNRFDPRQVIVKFRDGLHMRARNGALVSSAANELAIAKPFLDSLAGAKWRRVDRLSEERIEALRQVAQRKLGREIPDLNLQFQLLLPKGSDTAAIIDALNTLDIVELAQPVPNLVPLPTPPDLHSYQGYLSLAPVGIGATAVSTYCDVRGVGIKVADVEASYVPNHVDLPAVTLLGGDIAYGALIQLFAADHGTASLGAMGALDNGVGTTGIAPESSFSFSGVWEPDPDLPGEALLNIPGAVTTAISSLSAGDVLLIELQGQGPLGFAPIEWDKPIYDRIVLAVGLGIIVVEPAGNGANDLDAPAYSAGNNNHWPFLAANDSGAIIVGAGAPAGGMEVERSRLDFSNYGRTVDLQGWGQGVATTGFGGLYSAGGVNEYFGYYGGTSSASSVVAGGCALVQSISKSRTGNVLTAAQMKQLLSSTGTPQQSGTYPKTQNIGPLPNLRAALTQVNITRSGSLIILTWTGCGVLETSIELGANADWGIVSTIGNTYTFDLSNASSGSSHYYRVSWP